MNLIKRAGRTGKSGGRGVPGISKSSVCLTALVLALALGVAGCGDDETAEKAAPAATGATAGETATAAPEEGGAGKPGAPPKVSGGLKEKPEIAKPAGDPPTELVTKDIKKGKGRKAAEGDTVSVQYVGLSWSTGAEFDASWGRGEPFEFGLGQGNVIKGWDEGVGGMRVGGRRLLVIPPDLGYGEAGQPPAIAPNETLVFVVDLEKVR